MIVGGAAAPDGEVSAPREQPEHPEQRHDRRQPVDGRRARRAQPVPRHGPHPGHEEKIEAFIELIKPYGVVELARTLPSPPEIVHLHDWQVGLVPLFIKHQELTTGWRSAPASCLTIHNLAFQGLFDVGELPALVPEVIEPLAELEETIVQMSLGGEHACARTSAGTLYCWGNNDHGELRERLPEVARVQVEGLRLGVDFAALVLFYLVALITLDQDEVVPWAKERGLPTDLPTLSRTPEVRALIQEVVDEANSHFAHVSQIKRFTLLDRDLSQGDGELTPTLKVKRKTVHTTHAARYEELYG